MSGENIHPYRYRIRELRVARGMKIADLAGKINITNQYLSLIETGKRNLTTDLENRIAAALACKPADLHYSDYKTSDAPSLADELATVQKSIETENFEKESHIPVFSTNFEPNGSITLSTEVVAWIARPEPLLKVKGGFATYVMTDSMSPAYNAGDLLLVRTSRPAHQGEDVLVVFKSGNDKSREVWLRRLEGMSHKRLTLRQWNPSETSDIELSRIAEFHPVVGVFRR